MGGQSMSVKSPDKVDREVGDRIRAQRQAANLSQTILADNLGVSFQQVQKYEKGINRVGAGRLTKIAQVLGVPLGTLLGAEYEGKASRDASPSADSPLMLLTTPGARELLRSYGKLKDGETRRWIVGLVEHLVQRKRAEKD
jgi:transcriptional regulator with XRE-family HTH domain